VIDTPDTPDTSDIVTCETPGCGRRAESSSTLCYACRRGMPPDPRPVPGLLINPDECPGVLRARREAEAYLAAHRGQLVVGHLRRMGDDLTARRLERRVDSDGAGGAVNRGDVPSSVGSANPPVTAGIAEAGTQSGPAPSESASVRVGPIGFDGDREDAGAGRGRRSLVNPSPNHNSQRQRDVRTAGSGLTETRPASGPTCAGGGGGDVPAAGSAAKPVAPASSCSSDPGSIPGGSTTSRVPKAARRR